MKVVLGELVVACHTSTLYLQLGRVISKRHTESKWIVKILNLFSFNLKSGKPSRHILYACSTHPLNQIIKRSVAIALFAVQYIFYFLKRNTLQTLTPQLQRQHKGSHTAARWHPAEQNNFSHYPVLLVEHCICGGGGEKRHIFQVIPFWSSQLQR